MPKRFFVLLLVLLLVVPTLHAQRPDAPPYALRGDFPVGTREFVIEDADRPLTGTLWYPALNPEELEEAVRYQESLAAVDGRALRDAAPDMSAGPYPLVIFSHGLNGFRFQSAFYLEHLASQGFVVMATEHPGSTVVDAFTQNLTDQSIAFNFGARPLDILRQIDYAENINVTGDLAGLIDLERIAVTGHSFGGYTTFAVGGGRINPSAAMDLCLDTEPGEDDNRLCDPAMINEMAAGRGLDTPPDGLWDATTDPRIKAIILLAPAGATLFGEEGMAAVTIPTLVIVGSGDQVTPADENATPMYANVSSEVKAQVTLVNADHYIFVEQCTDQMISFGFFDSCSDDVWDMARAHDLTNHFATAFLLAVLKNDEAARSALLVENVDFAGVEYQTTLD